MGSNMESDESPCSPSLDFYGIKIDDMSTVKQTNRKESAGCFNQDYEQLKIQNNLFKVKMEQYKLDFHNLEKSHRKEQETARTTIKKLEEMDNIKSAEILALAERTRILEKSARKAQIEKDDVITKLDFSFRKSDSRDEEPRQEKYNSFLSSNIHTPSSASMTSKEHDEIEFLKEELEMQKLKAEQYLAEKTHAEKLLLQEQLAKENFVDKFNKKFVDVYEPISVDGMYDSLMSLTTPSTPVQETTEKKGGSSERVYSFVMQHGTKKEQTQSGDSRYQRLLKIAKNQRRISTKITQRLFDYEIEFSCNENRQETYRIHLYHVKLKECKLEIIYNLETDYIDLVRNRDYKEYIPSHIKQRLTTYGDVVQCLQDFSAHLKRADETE